MDLSVVDTHDNPDLVIHRTEIWVVWRPQVWRKKVWHLDAAVQLLHVRGAVCRCTVLLEQSPYQKLCVPLAAQCSMTSLWCCEAASKKTVRNITRISCFVTTMKLPHVLHIILSTVFEKKCMRLQFLPCDAMHSAAIAVTRYLSVRPSVRHVRELRQKE